jgi:hypothetical protein
MKTNIYEIILITESEVTILAVVNSKGLAYKTLNLYKEIYKDDIVEVKESRRKLKTITKTEYYLNGCKF